MNLTTAQKAALDQVKSRRKAYHEGNEAFTADIERQRAQFMGSLERDVMIAVGQADAAGVPKSQIAQAYGLKNRSVIIALVKAYAELDAEETLLTQEATFEWGHMDEDGETPLCKVTLAGASALVDPERIKGVVLGEEDGSRELYMRLIHNTPEEDELVAQFKAEAVKEGYQGEILD